MNFCDPTDTGRDQCYPQGNHTTGHSDCVTGWSDLASFGQLDARGCGVGCAPCLDYPFELVGHFDYRDGRRWLRPSPATLDAAGNRRDLRTNEPWPYPPGVGFEWGSCYHNTSGEQCFNRNVCVVACWPGGLAHVWSGDGRDCGATGAGSPVPEWFPDVFFLSGDGWRPQLYCRRFQDAPRQGTGLGTKRYLGRLLAPSFLRFGQSPYQSGPGHAHRPCATNMLTLCAGRFVGSSCNSAFANRIDPPDPGRIYWNNDVACRNSFDSMRIRPSEDLGILGGATAADRASARLRTAAIQHALTTELPGGPLGTRLDRVDHTEANGGDPSLWWRSWNTGAVQTCEVLNDPRTIVETLPDCFDPSGEPITVRVHVLGAEVGVYLALHRIAKFVSSTSERHVIEPHARIFVAVELGYTVVGSDTPFDPSECWRPPAGVRLRDRDGVSLYPPRFVEWFGYFGRLGIPDEDRESAGINYPIGGPGTPLQTQCLQAVAGLGTLTVRPWPSRRTMDDEPSGWPYSGSIDLWFADLEGCR